MFVILMVYTELALGAVFAIELLKTYIST